MNILFVCSANKDRSRTAEELFRFRIPNHQYDSAGTNIPLCRKYGTNELTVECIQNADLIFVMEKKHKEAVHQLVKLKSNQKVHILNIPDHYKFNDKRLIHLLVQKLEPFLQEKF